MKVFRCILSAGALLIVLSPLADAQRAGGPGGHEWSVWRDSLVDFGSKLFR